MTDQIIVKLQKQISILADNVLDLMKQNKDLEFKFNQQQEYINNLENATNRIELKYDNFDPSEKIEYKALEKIVSHLLMTKFANTGPKGPAGDKGIPGEPGRPGRDGKPGRDGINGKDGINGIDAKDGKDGIDGKNGRNGRDGLKGPDGKMGIQGLQGIRGEPGPQGIRGEMGEPGLPGEQGPRGLPGVQGQPGQRGEKGPPGRIGDTNNLVKMEITMEEFDVLYKKYIKSKYYALENDINIE